MLSAEITRLLHEAQSGRAEALDEVMELVYDDLHAIAASRLARRSRRRGKPSATLQPTELVNEAFLRLIKQRNRYDNRGQFFAIASQAMLRVLLDHDRAHRRDKRGGDRLQVSLSEVVPLEGDREPSIVVPAFVEAMRKLQELDERSADIAKMRILWGLTPAEVAAALELSLRTVERDWRFARRWLTAQLRGPGAPLADSAR